MSEENKSVDETAKFEVTTSDIPEVEAAPQGDEEATESASEADSETDGENDQKAEEATDHKEAGGDATEEAQPQPKKKGGGYQKRIDALVREREEAKRESEAKDRELAKFRNQAERRKQSKPEGDNKEPKEADFDTYDDYLDALDAFDNRETEKKPERKQKETQEAEDDVEEGGLTDSQKTALAVVQEAVESADNKPEDFDKVALDPDVHITGEMLEAIADCDSPVKVMYELGKNKSLSAEIAGKSPVQQAREIAKLNLAQADAKPQKPVKTTKAADPIEPVKGSDAQEKSLSEMTFKEYEAHMTEQEKKRASNW